MKKTIIGFILLLLSLVMAWFIRDLLLSTFIIPVLLGLVQLSRMINTFPQIVWWIALIISALSLFFTDLKFPVKKTTAQKRIRNDSGKLETLNSLIKGTLNSSTYSGQQLSLLLVNMYLKDQGFDEISIHMLEKDMGSEAIPEEIRAFVKTQFGDNKRHKNNAALRLTLEKAIKYLNSSIIGDSTDDRSSK